MIERKKYKLAGHKRILTPCGIKEHKQSKFSNGWTSECSCGWRHEDNLSTRKEAASAYSDHILISMPICHECGEVKPIREMSKSSRVLCKKCVTQKTKEWAKSHPNEWDRHRRASHLKKKYNLTIDEYDEIVVRQGNKCAICGGNIYDSRGFRPHIDHDHKTGKMRGVLCGYCNKALGRFKDDKEKLLSAYNYLLKSEQL